MKAPLISRTHIYHVDDLSQRLAATSASSEACGIFAVWQSKVLNELIVRCFAEARSFFDLPLSAKKQFTCSAPTSIGYSTRESGEYRGTNARGLHTNEMLDVAPPSAAPPYFNPGAFPTGFNAFSQVVADCHREFRRLELRFLEHFSVLLERNSGKRLGRSYLRRLQARHRGLLRLNYYPATSDPSRRGSLRNGEHIDWSSITLLIPDGPGLEVHDGLCWSAVAFEPGVCYVIIGEQLHRWSNGVFKAALHRVSGSANLQQPRQSIAYFATEHVDISDHTPISPVCASRVSSRFEPQSIRDYLLPKFDLLKGKTQ